MGYGYGGMMGGFGSMMGGFGIVFMLVYLGLIGYFFYLLISIAGSLKRIEQKLDHQIAPKQLVNPAIDNNNSVI